MAVRVEIYDSVIDSWAGPVGRWLDERSRTLETMAKATVGVDSGDLQRDIDRNLHPPRLNELQVDVGANTKVGPKRGYATLHHDGTRPHIIRPKPSNKSKRLYFRVGGKLVVAKQVNHPGTPPNRYLTSPMKMLFG